MPNLIRLKQLDLVDISGYIEEVAGGNGGGGIPDFFTNNYNYVSGDFSISNKYFNIANSNINITGHLPINISNGVRYNIKNIGSGELFLTGYAKIDNSLDYIILFENESVELLGVNKLPEYSGWVTISSNPGL